MKPRPHVSAAARDRVLAAAVIAAAVVVTILLQPGLTAGMLRELGV